MDTITFIATYFSISVAFAIFVLVLLIRRRRKQKARFENDWLLFQDAVKKDNTEQIIFYGSKVIWNRQKAEPKHREFVLVEVSKRKDSDPKLTKVWKDAFYLVNGKESG